MDNTEQIKYKYKCKYCKKVYNAPINECEACGSTEFIETAYTVLDKKKKAKRAAITIILIIIGLFIISRFLFSMFKSHDLPEFTIKEYAPSLLTDSEMYLGKNSDSSKADYYTIFKITGTYHDLYDNIYNNIYTTQFQRFSFSVPCDVEIKDGDFHMEITALDFSYYDEDTGYVDFIGSITGNTDKDISLYLADEKGNKYKLLLDDYYRDDYSSIAEFLCSDEFRKDLIVTASITEYKALIVQYGDSSYEFVIDYDRASGTFEYYAMNRSE